MPRNASEVSLRTRVEDSLMRKETRVFTRLDGLKNIKTITFAFHLFLYRRVTDPTKIHVHSID